MKRYLFLAALILPACVYAQSVKDYGFKTVKANPVTCIKDQHNSGTCWCFATTSFLESEAIRINNIPDSTLYPDFSEMFTLYRSYADRAVKYLRMDGKLTSGPGSIAPDLLHVVADYGIVPDSAMPCKTGLPELFGMDREIRTYLGKVLKEMTDNPDSRQVRKWRKGLGKILARELGECPETFKEGDKEYTPATYRDALGLRPDDYVTLSSFTHHPFYTSFALEVPDNWRWDSVWNIPLDELELCVTSALEKGYTVAWGSDISEPGYTWDGLAVVPEKEVSQELRQEYFDYKKTVDDHMMHIFGLARSNSGELFYMVKNSSGPNWGDPNHIWYASIPFFRGKTLYVTIHKDALPQCVSSKILK